MASKLALAWPSGSWGTVCSLVGAHYFLHTLTFGHRRLSASRDVVVLGISCNKRCATRQSSWSRAHLGSESVSNGDSRCELFSSHETSYNFFFRQRSKLLAIPHANILHTLTSSRVSIIASFIGLPDPLKYRPDLWNPTTHGNISFVIILLLFRCAMQLLRSTARILDDLQSCLVFGSWTHKVLFRSGIKWEGKSKGQIVLCNITNVLRKDRAEILLSHGKR